MRKVYQDLRCREALVQVLLMLLAVGCAAIPSSGVPIGQVEEVTVQRAVEVVQYGINSRVGSEIWAKGSKLIFTFPSAFDKIFVACDPEYLNCIFGGNLANGRSVRDLTETLGMVRVTSTYPAVQTIAKAMLMYSSGTFMALTLSINEDQLMKFMGQPEVVLQ